MVISKAKLAKLLHISPHTVADAVRIWGIVPKAVDSNARADGLDDDDVALICAKLGMEVPRVVSRPKVSASS